MPPVRRSTRERPASSQKSAADTPKTSSKMAAHTCAVPTDGNAKSVSKAENGRQSRDHSQTRNGLNASAQSKMPRTGSDQNVKLNKNATKTTDRRTSRQLQEHAYEKKAAQSSRNDRKRKSDEIHDDNLPEKKPRQTSKQKNGMKVAQNLSKRESKEHSSRRTMTKVKKGSSVYLKQSVPRKQNKRDFDHKVTDIKTQKTVNTSSPTVPSSQLSGGHCGSKRVKEEDSTDHVTMERKKTDELGEIKAAVTAKDDSQGTVEIMTDDSTSDSDFEEVQTQFRTPETSAASISLSDSSVSRKLEDSFSDHENSQDDKESEKGVGRNKSGKTVKKSDGSASSSATANKSKKTSSAAATDKKHLNSGTKQDTAPKQQKSQQKSSKGHDSVAHTSQSRSSSAKSSSSKTLKPESKKKTEKKAAPSPKKEKVHHKVDENDIMAVLLEMEGQGSSQAREVLAADMPSTSGMKKRCLGKKVAAATSSAHLQSDTDGGSDWEEVEDYKHSPVKSQIPEKPVQITINDPTLIRKKKKKKQFDWKAWVQRKIKRMAREIQVDMHKVHLLCLLSLGMQQNQVCSNPTLAAIALSTIPPTHLEKSVAQYTSRELFVFIKWFRSAFCLAKAPDSIDWSLVGFSKLAVVLGEAMAGDAKLLAIALVVLLRAMGFSARLVISFQPLPLKNTQASNQTKSGTKRKKEGSSGKDPAKPKSSKSDPSKSTKNSGGAKKSASKCSSTSEQVSKSKQQKTQPQKKEKSTPKRSKKVESSSSSSEDDDDYESDEPSASKKRRSSRPKPNKKKANTSVDSDDEAADLSDFDDSGSNFSDEEIVLEKKKKKGKGVGKGKGKKVSLSNSTEEGESDAEKNSEDEFDDSFSVRSLVSKKMLSKASRKILSSESSGEQSPDGKNKSGRNYWLEVFLPSEHKWICVDLVRIALGKPYDISAAASQPLLYVLAFDNDGRVKDLTAKYAPQWLSHTRKQRVDSTWWMETLELYAPVNEELDEEENDSIRAQLMQRPLPTSIGEYKSHPLYALQRHLLKYEAIYPESSIPVGYIRQEPVYARECVHTLHSRENWLREARVVRVGETAYKRVKSRKRWNKARDNPEELDLELFGFWQTEEYIPPPAVNGKVPKNEYGNVELFQPSMLPGGTVHIRVPGLNRVAKKLGIDIAAAMTGWDHHCGYSHPVLDGWVVCEEHKDVLLAAWEEDQAIQQQREEERREKRVLNNWSTLVRGLLIKEKLKKKFNLEEKKPPAAKSKKAVSHVKGELATDVQHAWPAKQQQQQKKACKGKTVPQPSHYTVETM